MVEPTRDGGYGMTAQWSDDFHHALHALVSGETQGYYVDFGTVDVLARTLTQVFRHAGDVSTFRAGAPWGRPVDPERHRGHRFLGYGQDHDQVGNRAVGDRISATASPGRLAAAAALVLTSPFTPMLFMGEEWGASTPWQFFTSHPEPELGEAVAKGRLEEFADMEWDTSDVPNPQDPETFTRSKLDWSEPSQGEHARLLALTTELLRIRRSYPDLTDPRFDHGEASSNDEEGWLKLERGAVVVVANFSDTPSEVKVEGGALETLVSIGAVSSEGDLVRLPGHAGVVLHREQD
jgi:maltooligosyltrehalose trehalohydrolase